MPDYMQDFDDNFEFKNKPDETTPRSAENLNRALNNTRLLKRFINDIITGRIDLIVRSIKTANLLDNERFYNEFYKLKPEHISKVNVGGVEYLRFRAGIDLYFMRGEFKENTQYTLSFFGYSSVNVKSTGFLIHYTDGTNRSLYVEETNPKLYSLTTDENKTIDYISIPWLTNDYVFVREIMLNEGTEVKPYGPHIDF